MKKLLWVEFILGFTDINIDLNHHQILPATHKYQEFKFLSSRHWTFEQGLF